MVSFPAVPREVKPLSHLLKLAEDHDETKIIVAYWARMSASQFALRLVPGKKSVETEELIRKLLEWLEETKKANEANEGITNQTTAHAFIEDYALKLLEHGNQQDMAQIFNKNTVKIFYTVGMLMDVLEQFEPLSNDMKQKRKFAKWKAVYIHNSLKAGELPLPGPPTGVNEYESGIVHNSDIPKEELATYTKYTGYIPLNTVDTDKLFADKPNYPNTPSEENLGLNVPKPDNGNNVVHAPNSSNTSSIVSLYIASQPATIKLRAPTGAKQMFITPGHILKALMYSEFATTALRYGEIKYAVENLHKALNLLQAGGDVNNKL